MAYRVLWSSAGDPLFENLYMSLSQNQFLASGDCVGWGMRKADKRQGAGEGVNPYSRFCTHHLVAAG